MSRAGVRWLLLHSECCFSQICGGGTLANSPASACYSSAFPSRETPVREGEISIEELWPAALISILHIASVCPDSLPPRGHSWQAGRWLVQCEGSMGTCNSKAEAAADLQLIPSIC